MLTFAQSLATSYKRVNKAGSFNTRCFPGCNPGGHADSSYCGRPFVVLASGFAPGAVFYAEFAPQAAQAKTTSEAFSPEGFYGDVLAHGVVAFNVGCAAWKYSWKSSRHTYETPHVVRVYVMDPGSRRRIVHVQDSSPFAVSSTRAAAEKEAQQSELLAVLDAMARLVPTSRCCPMDMFGCSMENDASVAASSPGDADMGWEDDSSTASLSLSLSDDEEARFLAHEQLCGVLERLYAFMMPQYPTWRCAADMRADVDMYLRHNESTTLEQFAAIAASNDTQQQQQQQQQRKPAYLDFSHDEATATARSFLYEGEYLVDGITLNGPNDPSGLFWRDDEFSTRVCHEKLNAGWSPVDVDVHARVECVCIAALSPTMLFKAFLGPNGHSDIFSMAGANVPADMRPTLFGACAASRVAYVFATNKGTIQIVRGHGFDNEVFLAKHWRTAEGMTMHVQFRELPSNKVVKDDLFMFKPYARS